MCAEAGAKLGYPPYSPDLGPIEDFFFFAGLKSLVKRNWRDERDSGQGFDVFMEYCIKVAGGKEEC
jgi:transposase